MLLTAIIFQQFLLADSSSSLHEKIISRISTGNTVKEVVFSEDGRYLLVSYENPFSLKLYTSNDKRLLKQHWLSTPSSKTANNPRLTDFIFDAPSRQSFIAGFGNTNQLWEILYEDNPLPIYNGVMHDYRLDEGLVRDQSQFPMRIIRLAGKPNIPISSYYFYPPSGLLFIARDKIIEVIQLDARQTIATIDFNGKPDLSASIQQQIKHIPHILVPFFNQSGAKLINIRSWVITEDEHY